MAQFLISLITNNTVAVLEIHFNNQSSIFIAIESDKGSQLEMP